MVLLTDWPRRAALLCAMIAAPAAAELGGSPRTVAADRAHLAAAISSTAAPTYTMHSLATANGRDRPRIRQR